MRCALYNATQGRNVAARNRAPEGVADYAGVPAIEEALAILVSSYDAMGMTLLRDDALRVLTKNYPQSVFLQDKAPARTKSWWRP